MFIPEYLYEKYLTYLVKEGEVKPAGNKFIFRCFICGDSKVSSEKARGALIYNEEGATICCFNCGARVPFFDYLVKNHIDLFKDLMKELNNGSTNTYRRKQKKVHKEEVAPSEFKSIYDMSDSPIRKLCVDMVQRRKLPYIFSTGLKYADEGRYAGRLIIPYYRDDGSYDFISARDVTGNDLVEKYITPYNNNRPIYNIDFVDFSSTIFAAEGEMDSSFMYNSLGFGSNTVIEDVLCKHKDSRFNTSNIIVVPDNDLPGIKTAHKCMRHGYRVMRWPTRMCKDINEAVMKGIFKINEEGKMPVENVMGLVLEPTAYNIYLLGRLTEALTEDKARRIQNDNMGSG